MNVCFSPLVHGFFLIIGHEILTAQIYCLSIYVLYVVCGLYVKRVSFLGFLRTSFHPRRGEITPHEKG